MKRTKHQNINGWLIVDKPSGMGSTEVVNLTRKFLDANKNGHAGTLDPFATGVLPIAFGEATKLIAFVMNGPKEYEFVLKFGEETSTDDLEGEVVARCEYIPSEAEILKILPSFTGKIMQVPPMYSAIKINGERAYKLARQGKTAQLEAREIEIFDLSLLEKIDTQSFKFKVVCSKGTYVRTLGHDIARKLNSFGHLTALRRTKCAIFSVSDTILLEKLKNMVYQNHEQDSLLPVETALRDIAVLAVSAEDAAKLRLGQGISPKPYNVQQLYGSVVAAFDGACLIALVRVEERKISPIRVFNFN